MNVSRFRRSHVVRSRRGVCFVVFTIARRTSRLAMVRLIVTPERATVTGGVVTIGTGWGSTTGDTVSPGIGSDGALWGSGNGWGCGFGGGGGAGQSMLAGQLLVITTVGAADEFHLSWMRSDAALSLASVSSSAPVGFTRLTSR
jgi:hypothetical protein